MRILRRADLEEIPWKNGGGITRNIASQMDGDTTLWRLSMADVASAGPFSNFAGLTRVLTVIEGDGMVLHGPDGDLKAGFAQPVTFDGATPITATLTQGPICDFNLMFDTDRCEAEAATRRGPLESELAGGANTVAVLHCITGTTAIGDETLMPGDTVISQGLPVSFALPDGAIVLAITLRLERF